MAHSEHSREVQGAAAAGFGGRWPGGSRGLPSGAVAVNEMKFIKLYAELTECSESRARSVYMVISERLAWATAISPRLTNWIMPVRAPGLVPGRADQPAPERKP